MRKNLKAGAAVLGILFAALHMSANAALAELLITSSTAPDIKNGTVLPDGVEFNIPAGATVSILRKPQQRTYTLEGPFTGTLLDYLKRPKCGWWRRLFGNCADGPRRSDPVGGVRSARPPVGGARSPAK